MLEFFLSSNDSLLIKIDPDTEIAGELPEMPKTADIAGDFRMGEFGWIWFGAAQYFTRSAAEKIMNDCPDRLTLCQDITIAESSRRLGLRAYNMEDVNGWNTLHETVASVRHPGHGLISRLSPGFISWR